jgi:glutamate/tyrosine decarboxylase-like PLP-dependent enzyme
VGHDESSDVTSPVTLLTPGRPLERAQLVWRRAQERSRSIEEYDAPAEALGLSRAAHHDAATMSHALGLGHERVRRRPDDTAARRGVRALERAIAFLGGGS